MRVYWKGECTHCLEYRELKLGLYDNYQVMGVNCEENEVVSCLLVECSGGDYCPAENYCFNPKCVCRKGYRKVRGVCIPKHTSLYLKPKVLETALLEMPYREDFSLKKY
nr:uncharacterized protein LOC108120764 [Drosophila bipectinata]